MRSKRLVTLMLAGTISISAMFGGCSGSSIDADAKGAVFNEEEISLGYLNFMAKYQQAVYDGYYVSMFGTDMWTQDLYGNGSTFQESVKEEIITELENILVLEANMADYDVEITEDEKKAMNEAAKQFMEDNSNKAIKQLGATEEYVERLLTLQTIKKKMYDKIVAEVDQEVSDEEAAQRTFSYVAINKNTTTDEEGNSVEYTDEQKEELETDVKDFVKELKKDFEGAAESGGYTVSVQSYGKDDESFDADVLAEADKLKEGEISGLISTDENYYIIRLDKEFDEEATATKKESILSQRESDHYTEVLDKYKEDATFELDEKQWAKITFDKLFSAKVEEEAETEDSATEDDNSEDSDGESEDDSTEEDDNNTENDESKEADDAE